MKANRIRILAVGLGLALVAAIAVSQTVQRVHMRGRGMWGEHMLNYYADALDLTDAQQAQMKDIWAKERTALQPLFEQMRQSHQQMRQLEESGTFDEAKVRSLASQQAQVITEMIVQKARIKSEMFQVLTPEQKAKAAKLMDRHERRFMKHMGPPAATQSDTQ